MFVLFVIYAICIIFIWWSYAGYIFYLFVYYLLRRGSTEQAIKQSDNPTITVIVPIFDEEELITRKINNLKKLLYSGEVEFILVDGGSTDKTVPKLKKLIKNSKKFKFLITNKGKINQLNRGLVLAKGEIVVCTDVDAILPTNALKILAGQFMSNKKIGLVGAYIIPKGDSLEKEYWQEQNQLRMIESVVYSASIICAPCFAFRSALFKSFPEDCVADDVYLSFYMQSQDYLVKYDSRILVYELRASKNILEFFTHKFRKANAYITELLRFVYAINKLNIRFKIIFLTRFLQVIILPWILLLFTAISVNLIIINNSYRLAVAVVFIFLGLSAFLAALLFNQGIFSLKLRAGKTKIFNFKIFLYSNIILFFAIFAYLFFHQDSSFQKIKNQIRKAT